MQVDHIDGNSNNNILSNLRILCPNCHSQTDTFAARNKKNTKRNRYLSVYKQTHKRQNNAP
jgi:5-methylcytosine-specific restriction endonuclease McrA